MNPFEKTIYLDHAASTPIRNEASEAMRVYAEFTGNPSSIHHEGRRASAALEKMRGAVAILLGVEPSEIIFTGSGSEANNLALIGTLHTHRARGGHILISAIEHKSVMETAAALTKEGFVVEYIPVDEAGMVQVADVQKLVREDTVLVSIMYANNEIGTIEPIEAIGKALRALPKETRPLFHTDACQAAGQLPLLPEMLGVDLMTLNSSKVYGPKGVGLLYAQKGVHIEPRIYGGEQERGRRGGTENLAGIAGFVTALTLAESEREETSHRMTLLRDVFIEKVLAALPSARLNGHKTERLPNNIHFSFPHIEGESLVLLLDTYGICASTGSACNAHNLLPSHVLRALGQTPELIHGSLRLTLGKDTTEEELDETLAALVASVKRLEALSPLPLSL